MRHGILKSLLAALCLVLGAGAVSAADCTRESFATAVDEAAAGLRRFNSEAQPALAAKMKKLAEKKGWPAEGYEEKAYAYLEDGRIAELNQQSNELLTKIDSLGRPPEGKEPDCAELANLKAAGVELIAVMRTKAAYMTDKLDIETGGKAAEVAKAPPAAAPRDAAKDQPSAAAKPAAAAAPPAKPADKKADTSWDTKTAASPQPLPPAPPAASAGEPYSLPPVAATGPEPGGVPGDGFVTETEGYTIDEIRDVTRGFFGTISTSLASVIEHAFAESGRPTAYVLGTEGGGAFLAGLRYGSGTLYMRAGETRKVYWHGPSLGYDLGAEGGRTLFLIYRLRAPERLYRMFTGIDGSAYLVGGVGMTLLKGGDVIMAPIRSGIGLRLGANIGYIRFTDRPTWNPF